MRSEVEPRLQMHACAACEGSIPRQCPAQSLGTPCLYLNTGLQALLFTDPNKQHLQKKKIILTGRVTFFKWHSFCSSS